MRIATIVPALLALGCGEVSEIAHAAERRLSVCMERGADTAVEQRARALAGQIFTEIDVGIEWSCSGGSREAITIAISSKTPDRDLPGALAYAQPFAYPGHILVFCDRVSNAAPEMMRARLLAYVLVHEIAHVLQGTTVHSDRGIMKVHWDDHDFRKMLSMGLKFTAYDVLLIHHGMDADRSRVTQPLLTRVR